MGKKKVIIIIIAVVVIIGAVMVGLGVYSTKSEIEPMPAPIPYTTLDELKGKIDALEAVRVKDKLSWQDTYRLGIAYMHSGKFPEAVVVLNEAREAYPSFYKIDEATGMAYYRQDELDGAIESWSRALELNPGAEHLENMIVRAKRKRGVRARIDILEAELKEVGVKSSKSPLWSKRFELASLYLVDSRVEDTIKVLNKALEEKSDSSDIYDLLALAYVTTKDFGGAVKAEKKAIKYYKKAADGLGGDEELSAMKQRLSDLERIAKVESEGGFHKAP